jgi:hypothetical protein
MAAMAKPQCRKLTTLMGRYGPVPSLSTGDRGSDRGGAAVGGAPGGEPAFAALATFVCFFHGPSRQRVGLGLPKSGPCGCATVGSEHNGLNVCPPVFEKSREFQPLAAGSALAKGPDDRRDAELLSDHLGAVTDLRTQRAARLVSFVNSDYRVRSAGDGTPAASAFPSRSARRKRHRPQRSENHRRPVRYACRKRPEGARGRSQRTGRP